MYYQKMHSRSFRNFNTSESFFLKKELFRVRECQTEATMAKSRSRSRARSLVPHEVTITTPEDPEFDKVKELLERSSNIIAVTGAGMSTSCGIPVRT